MPRPRGINISIWDLHKEIDNLTKNDSLRPRNYDKGPQWLQERIRELPRSCDVSTMAYRLDRLEYRALWRDMAKEHQRVVSTLIDASRSTDRGYDCLFSKALKEMVAFLELFATRAAPFSRSASRDASGSDSGSDSAVDNDNQFEMLMDNFGIVIDTLSIFYDRFDCEGRSEGLKLERDEKRMALFCFDKNEPRPPRSRSEVLRILYSFLLDQLTDYNEYERQ
ncbi:hypothetical protein DFP73DRAFT_526027 [Morchella snyderi]|nr:hypothetical protein DFP73DRAFT_526027 [Morchella snyderi]